MDDIRNDVGPQYFFVSRSYGKKLMHTRVEYVLSADATGMVTANYVLFGMLEESNDGGIRYAEGAVVLGIISNMSFDNSWFKRRWIEEEIFHSIVENSDVNKAEGEVIKQLCPPKSKNKKS